jgi:hypothetical protein
VIDVDDDADAMRFGTHWPRPRHRDAIARADEEHLLSAQRAYAAAGFVHEGVLREVLYINGRFESLVVMSVLRAEWKTLRTR